MDVKEKMVIVLRLSRRVLSFTLLLAERLAELDEALVELNAAMLKEAHDVRS